MMKVLVVTGGIGSGKSEVCRIIEDAYGCGIYPADDRVKLLYGTCPELVEGIESALDISVRDRDGHFVPKLLADVIFNDRHALEIVESLVFPALMSDFKAWAEDHKADRFVVFESATILEKPQLKGFGDKVILVDAPFEVRLERACRRDSAARAKVIERMDNQVMMNMVSEGSLIPEVDAVIRNDGNVHDLEQKVLSALDGLLGKIE